MKTAGSELTSRQLAALIGTVVLVAAPHALRLPPSLVLLAVLLLAWRLYLARARLALPHRAMIAALVLAASGTIVVDYGTLLDRDAGVALLVSMLALKLLETATRRDAMLVSFLCFFVVITNLLYSQSIPTALYMAACVWFIVVMLIDLQHAQRAAFSGRDLRLAGAMLAQSLPLMLVLFLLFPRIEGPLWGRSADTPRAVTGLSETMSPGSLSDLVASDAVALRASFKSRVPEPGSLYWRGPVLTDYDGMTWRAGPIEAGMPKSDGSAPAVEYTVTVEPHGKPWLFAIDLPGRTPPHSLGTRDMQILSAQPVTARARYDMVSFVDRAYGLEERPSVLQRASRLPPAFNPRTVALARELRDRHPGDRALMQAVLTMFNQQDFVYTVSPPLLGQHGVDEFLFETRSGFCEHYASAFTVLMRAAGIPARVVTGYLGGEINPISDHMIVRQSDAHAWAEVWLEREGWVRVDPTAAVAPARVAQGSSAVGAASPLASLFRGNHRLLRHLRFGWDSITAGWNDWVLEYVSERQRSLLTRAGFDRADWRTLAAALFVATTLVVLALALTILRRLRSRVRDPLELAYGRFCGKLARVGLPRDAYEGPLDYAERVGRARPELAAGVRRFLLLYANVRYGSGPDNGSIAALQALARQFNPRAAGVRPIAAASSARPEFT